MPHFQSEIFTKQLMLRQPVQDQNIRGDVLHETLAKSKNICCQMVLT